MIFARPGIGENQAPVGTSLSAPGGKTQIRQERGKRSEAALKVEPVRIKDLEPAPVPPGRRFSKPTWSTTQFRCAKEGRTAGPAPRISPMHQRRTGLPEDLELDAGRVMPRLARSENGAA